MTSSESAGGTGRGLPRLHAVTDDRVLAETGWIDRAALVLQSGGPDVALHVRGSGTGSRRLLELLEALLPHARRFGAALFVNDRVDVALVSELDGVHLGAASLDAHRARALLGPAARVGVSCHGADEVIAAMEKGADYVFLGTIYATATHPESDGVGTEGVEAAVERAGAFPIVGIGGIGPTETREVAAAGAYGVAAIRGIWEAAEPAAAVSEYLEGLGD